MRAAVTVVGWLAGATAVLLLGFVVAFRVRFRPVLDLVRRMNRRFINPRTLQDAGQPGADASVVHHTGRASGRAYRTPVVARRVPDGFVVALPYGPDADWVRNVVAAGAADLQHDGSTVPVDRPRLVGAEDVNHHFDALQQRTHGLFGLDDFLHLHLAER